MKTKEDLKDKTTDLNFRIWDIQENIDSDKKRLASINIGVLRLKKASADALEHKIKKTRKALNNLILQETKEKEKIKMLSDHKYDPNCNFCCDNKFVKDAHEAKKSLPETTSKIIHLQQLIRDFEDSLNELDIEFVDREISVYNALEEHIPRSVRTNEMNMLAVEGNKSRINLLQKEYTELCEKKLLFEANREDIENLELLKREQSDFLSMIKMKENSYKKCQDKITSILIEQGSTQSTLKTLQENRKELEDVEREWVAYDLFLQCMHANGIPYNIIKQKLPLLNEEISKILGDIVDFEVFFENDVNNLNILIKHPFYDPRPLSMGSGAEKTIAAMAIRLALISITNLPKSELFILDEPATALDQEHMEGFTNLLRIIKNQFKTVILISHLDSLKDVVDMTIDISKINGYASVRV